jgi:hypothetical protein
VHQVGFIYKIIQDYFQYTCVLLFDTIFVHTYKLNTMYLRCQGFLRGDVGEQTTFTAIEIQMNITGKPRKLKQCNYTGSIQVSVLLHEERTLNHSTSCCVKHDVFFSTQSYYNTERRCHSHMRFRQLEMSDVLLIWFTNCKLRNYRMFNLKADR